MSQIGNLPQVGMNINKYLKPPPGDFLGPFWDGLMTLSEVAGDLQPGDQIGHDLNHLVVYCACGLSSFSCAPR